MKKLEVSEAVFDKIANGMRTLNVPVHIGAKHTNEPFRIVWRNRSIQVNPYFIVTTGERTFIHFEA